MNVYLDNAASTPLHPAVLDEMLPYFKQRYGNPSSVHTFGKKNKAAVELSRKTIAKHLNAKSKEIFFCSSGTEANNIVLKQAVENLRIERIISSKIEHKCVQNTLQYLAKRDGIELEYVQLDKYGVCDLDSLKSLLSHSSKITLVSLIHAHNELGSLNPIYEIAQICESHNALFHSDSVQSIAHHIYDLSKSHIHFLTASAHKFHGPLGSGFLYCNEKTNLSTWIHGGGQERNMRSGTENVAGIVGLSKAFDLAQSRLVEDTSYLRHLRNHFKEGLSSIYKNIKFNEAKSNVPTILSVTIPSFSDLATLLIRLDMEGVAVSGGSACSSGSIKFSSTLQALNYNENEATLRISFSVLNTIEEIDYALSVFKKMKN